MVSPLATSPGWFSTCPLPCPLVSWTLSDFPPSAPTQWLLPALSLAGAWAQVWRGSGSGKHCPTASLGNAWRDLPCLGWQCHSCSAAALVGQELAPASIQAHPPVEATTPWGLPSCCGLEQWPERWGDAWLSFLTSSRDTVSVLHLETHQLVGHLCTRLQAKTSGCQWWLWGSALDPRILVPEGAWH